MLFSGAAADNASAQTQKIDTASKPAFVIVHGAWGGSWAFRRVAALLNEKGYAVYRPSLTGLGERVHMEWAMQATPLRSSINQTRV
jgi:dienelactone hydrolase